MSDQQYDHFIHYEVLFVEEIKDLTELEKDKYYAKLKQASDYEHRVFGW